MFFAAAGLLAAGGAAWLADAHSAATGLWVAATLLGILYSTATIADALIERRPTVDVIAWLALVGALLVNEPFAGAVIALMLGTGGLLEARAGARARRELSLLAERAPRTARRVEAAGVVEIPIGEVRLGDRLVVGSGEIVPVDGRLLEPALLDESALTGEALPVERHAGEDVRSGVVNAGAPAALVATALADQSTYTAVVRLVEQAQAATAPFVRAADRLAVAFVPLTLLLAGGAWASSGHPARAVAVLVVATPCPLLLGVPIAIMSGLSRAARLGVVVKGGSALERLAAGRVMLFDKTGTLTRGRPVLTDVITEWSDPNELLRLAASVDQSSAHILATAIVTAARERGLRLRPPHNVVERHGYGLEGTVDGHRVRLGKASWVVSGPPPAWVRHARRRAFLDGSLTVFVSVDDAPAGVFLFEDPVRPDAPRMIRSLRLAGVERVVLVTGDRADVAETVGRVVGVDAVHSELDPKGKLTIVREEQARAPTIMVGDGINDAPALAAAGVGVALAARGSSASAEAADIVLTVDRLDALADAILIAHRCRRIARRSAAFGMGVSLVAMLAAAAGFLAPAAGAVLQEGIDVAAIGIALTALFPVRAYTVPLAARDIAIAQRLYDEHRAVRTVVEQIRSVADTLHVQPDLKQVRELLGRLERDLLPHERAEEEELLPIMARALGGADPVGALSRTHAEIEHHIGRLRRLLDDLDDPIGPEDIVEIQRLLFGLYAILRLHNAQEEESAFSLIPEAPPGHVSAA